MTKQEKHDLADMVRRGLTVEQILKRTTAVKATVKRYIKALRPNAGDQAAAPETEHGQNQKGKLNMEDIETQPQAQLSLHRLVRPLAASGEADCPKCGALKSVARHNADWTCYKCGYLEVVDEDRESQRSNAELSDRRSNNP